MSQNYVVIVVERQKLRQKFFTWVYVYFISWAGALGRGIVYWAWNIVVKNLIKQWEPSTTIGQKNLVTKTLKFDSLESKFDTFAHEIKWTNFFSFFTLTNLTLLHSMYCPFFKTFFFLQWNVQSFHEIQ